MKKKILPGFMFAGILLIAFAFNSNKLQSNNKEDSYRIHNNKIYRVFGKGEYQILDTAEFYLYYAYEQVEKVKGKALVKTDEYFFSKNAESPIILLTAENLKKAFPDNLPFHYAIDAQFKSDQDLIAYDPYFKGYKLKYVYKHSLK
ncbi:MAG TPA: hypothetical protein VK711_05005 [Puia sp.]|jgi:hypothetical protein|nr:hypothetical protein [Puia sp.]